MNTVYFLQLFACMVDTGLLRGDHEREAGSHDQKVLRPEEGGLSVLHNEGKEVSRPISDRLSFRAEVQVVLDHVVEYRSKKPRALRRRARTSRTSLSVKKSTGCERRVVGAVAQTSAR